MQNKQNMEAIQNNINAFNDHVNLKIQFISNNIQYNQIEIDAILSLKNENKTDFVSNTDSYTKNLHLYLFLFLFLLLKDFSITNV